MEHTIPKKALVALPDFLGGPTAASPRTYRVVTPEEALVPAFDRSFHFGDSLYEVTRTYGGILFSLEEHLRRLEKSARLAMYEVPLDLELARTMVLEACKTFFRTFGNLDVYVRITVSRGLGDLNIDRKYASAPYFVVFVKELEPLPDRAVSEGVEFALVERRRNHPQALDPAMKSGNYLNNVLAIREAKLAGASDALMLNHSGFVTEGTTNNFWMVKDGVVWTAPLDAGILAGITRDWILAIAPKAGVKIEERLFRAEDLGTASEMFYSSSTREIVPITKLSGALVATGKPGPITLRLRDALRSLIEGYCRDRKAESMFR